MLPDNKFSYRKCKIFITHSFSFTYFSYLKIWNINDSHSFSIISGSYFYLLRDKSMHSWLDIDLSNFIGLSDVVSRTMNSETLADTGTMWDFIGRPWFLAKLLTLFRVRDTIVRRSQTGKIQHGRLMVAANGCTSHDSCASLENSLARSSLSPLATET